MRGRDRHYAPGRKGIFSGRTVRCFDFARDNGEARSLPSFARLGRRGRLPLRGFSRPCARLQGREFVLTFLCFFLFGAEAAFQESSGQVLTSQAKCNRQP